MKTSLEQLEFTYKKNKQEFKPLKKYKRLTSIHSIRFGTINPHKGFVNHTDYSVDQISLTHTGNDSIILQYNNVSYLISQKDLLNNRIVKFIKL